MNKKYVGQLSPVNQAVKACIPSKVTYRLAAGVMALGLALSVATPVSADTFTVTNTNDSGSGSLREAIELTNTNPGHDTINLSSVSGEIDGSYGAISESVNIVGPGPEKLRINNNLNVGDFFANFIYDYGNNDVDVSISGITLEKLSVQFISAINVNNVHLNSLYAGSQQEIGIDKITISNSLIKPNQTTSLSNAGLKIIYGGDVSIINTRITGHDTGILAPRIHPYVNTKSLKLTCQNCIIDDNNTGMLIQGARLNSINLIGSVVTENKSGIRGNAQFEINNSTISGNSETGLQLESYLYFGEYRSIASYGRAVILGTTISSNGSSGIATLPGTTSIDLSTPSPATLNIENSTISNNLGAGIDFFTSNSLAIKNTTIVGNQSGGLANNTSSVGYSRETIVINSVIAGNGTGGKQDIAGDTPIQFSHSLIQNPGTTAYEEIALGSNLIGVDPLLAPLELNNGPIDNETPTHALLAASPAIEAGDTQNCPATDQRGLERPQGAGCDIGAFEAVLPYSSDGVMGDYVWLDANGDGVQDANESGLVNVQVELRTCAGPGSKEDTIVDITTTDTNGHYAFNGAWSGGLSMRFILPDEYRFSPEKRGGDILRDSNVNPQTGRTLCYGNNNSPRKRTAIDVGMVPTANAGNGVMGDTIWRDSNADGIHDNNEPGLPFVNVDLLTCDGSILDSTASDTNGHFVFTQLTEGQYRMQFHKPAGFSISPEKSGTDRQKDSNLNQATGLTLCYPMAKDQKRTAIDAGMVPDTTIDNVSIVSAIYFTADQRLWIRAESDAQPKGSANITATMQVNGVGRPVGTIGWKPPKGYYQQVFDGITEAPTSVTLTSDLGGTITNAVTVR